MGVRRVGSSFRSISFEITLSKTTFGLNFLFFCFFNERVGLDQVSANIFSVKSHTVNISGFTSHLISVACFLLFFFSKSIKNYSRLTGHTKAGGRLVLACRPTFADPWTRG